MASAAKGSCFDTFCASSIFADGFEATAMMARSDIRKVADYGDSRVCGKV